MTAIINSSSEEETFRILLKSPYNILYEAIMVWSYNMEDIRDIVEVIEAHGWTEAEFNAHM